MESVRTRKSDVQFFQGWADDVNFAEQKLTIEESVISKYGSSALTAEQGSLLSHDPDQKGQTFELNYDKLVVAVGYYSQTFGTKGVRENAFFLKDVGDARRIRKRILDCFETAALPSTSDELRDSLLNFAIVGGGPTGVEFAAELSDLCREDLKKIYPDLVKYVRVSIYDVSSTILGMFDRSLADYAIKTFRRENIKIKTEHHIEELRQGLPGRSVEASAGCFTLKTKEDGEVGVGMCVWSTGLMMNPFIQKSLDTVHTYPSSSAILCEPAQRLLEASSQDWKLARDIKTGGLLVNSRFQVQLVPRDIQNSTTTNTSKPIATMTNVFALGDVSTLPSPLPATAQVAAQQANWLAAHLNSDTLSTQTFSYNNLGVMTYLGNWKAIMQTDGHNGIRGWMAWVIWRGAYLTKTFGWRNKILIPIYWCVNWIFGRDISRF